MKQQLAAARRSASEDAAEDDDEDTPAGVPGTFLPCSFCKTADACKVSGCVDAKIGRAIAAGERAAAGVAPSQAPSAPPCGKTPCPPGQICKSPFCRANGVLGLDGSKTE